MRSLPVLFRESALADLDSLSDYFLHQGASRSTVKAFFTRIRTKCEKIGYAPFGYPVASPGTPELRMTPFEHSAVIFYVVSGEAVEIVGIYYGGRDYSDLLET